MIAEKSFLNVFKKQVGHPIPEACAMPDQLPPLLPPLHSRAA
jgi:hypothetical protein